MAVLGGGIQRQTTGPGARSRRIGTLPLAAIAVFAGFLFLALAVAGRTLGYDFLAYHAAAARVIHGQPLYDVSFDSIGGFGLFLYPPTALPLILPFGALEPGIATGLWIVLLLAAFGIGVVLMPVPRSVQWTIVLLAGLSWPFMYAIKLGQVGPLLFLTFAAGWRWMDRPAGLGASAAIGAAIKLQPLLLLSWAVLTGRCRAALWGALVLLALGIATAVLAGLAGWIDFATLLRQLTDPIQNDRNVAAGAVLFRLGVPLEMARLVQLLSAVAVVIIVVVTAWRANPVSSYMVAVVASQLLWPVVWEHYGMLLLLPVAYLLSIGWRWAAIIPLATATVLVAFTPPLIYPVAFYVTMLAIVAAGWRPAEVSRAAEPSFA